MRRNSEEFLEKIKRIPLILPSFISLLCIYGFVLLYSAAGGSIEPWAQKQVIAFCIFMPISLLIALIDLRIIYQLSYFFYFVLRFHYLVLVLLQIFFIYTVYIYIFCVYGYKKYVYNLAEINLLDT